MKQLTYLLLLSFFAALFGGCEKESDVPSINTTNYSSDNEWIHAQMKFYYLWSSSIPTYDQTESTLSGVPYFASLLYKAGQREGDRFSYIKQLTTDAKSFTVIHAEEVLNALGFRCKYYYVSSLSNAIVGIVTVVAKDSPAYLNGLRRGSLFNAINGNSFSSGSQAQAILNRGGTIKLSLCKQDAVTHLKEITFNTSPTVESNPIALDTLYRTGGHTIGYMVYTNFSKGNNNEYITRLKQTFQEMKQHSVTDFILDLRYNPGGYVSTAIMLGSLIVNNSALGKPYVITEYNSTYAAELKRRNADFDTDPFLSASEIDSYNINMQHLYVLTSSSTASASELTIHCLRPYMNVTVIGERTVGKNLSAITLFSSNNQWVLSPLVGRIHNSSRVSDYENGIAPDIELAAEKSNAFSTPLGDTKNDPFLAMALSQITNSRSKSAPFIAKGVDLKEQKVAIDDGIIRDFEK